MGLQFPLKMHMLLDQVAAKGQSDIISWVLPQGNCFRVYDKERFETEIMPFYFKTKRYKSFQRNLNVWGFETKTARECGEKRAIFHEYFRRGQTDLCQLMTRVGKIQTPKESQSRKKQAERRPARFDPQSLPPPLLASRAKQSERHAKFDPQSSVPCMSPKNASHAAEAASLQQQQQQHRQQHTSASNLNPLLSALLERLGNTITIPALAATPTPYDHAIARLFLLFEQEARQQERAAAALSLALTTMTMGAITTNTNTNNSDNGLLAALLAAVAAGGTVSGGGRSADLVRSSVAQPQPHPQQPTFLPSMRFSSTDPTASAPATTADSLLEQHMVGNSRFLPAVSVGSSRATSSVTTSASAVSSDDAIQLFLSGA